MSIRIFRVKLNNFFEDCFCFIFVIGFHTQNCVTIVNISWYFAEPYQVCVCVFCHLQIACFFITICQPLAHCNRLWICGDKLCEKFNCFVVLTCLLIGSCKIVLKILFFRMSNNQLLVINYCIVPAFCVD